MKRRKLTKAKKHEIFVGIAWSFLILCFLAIALQGILVSRNIDTGNQKEFSGAYERILIHRGRNSHTHFALENGDVLCVRSDLERSRDLTGYSELHFRYCKPNACILPPAYSCTEITDMKGDTVFLSLEASRREAMGLFYLGVGFVALLLLLTILSVSYFRIPKRRKHK